MAMQLDRITRANQLRQISEKTGLHIKTVRSAFYDDPKRCPKAARDKVYRYATDLGFDVKQLKLKPRKADQKNLKKLGPNLDLGRADNVDQLLLASLGEKEYLRLIECAGGLIMTVPGIDEVANSPWVNQVTLPILRKLARQYPGLRIEIPIDREFRCKMYLLYGYSDRRIARLLMMPEKRVAAFAAKIAEMFQIQRPGPFFEVWNKRK